MKKTCPYRNCKKPTIGRGLCANHYYQSVRLVKNNRTTWEKLEQNKLAIPSRKKEDSLFRINSRILPEQQKYIKQYAKKLNMSESNALRSILEQFIAKNQ